MRTYAGWLGGVIAGALVLAAILTSLVDPWRVVGAPWSIKSLEPYREIGDAVRVGKTGMVRRGAEWEAAVFGTSHMEIGIDPRHPSFGGMRTINLGMAGSSILENVALCRYLMEQSQSLKLVIFGVDPGDICTDLDTRKNTDFPNSRLADTGFSIERELGYVFGVPAVEASFVLLGNALREKKSERDELGFWNNFYIMPDIRRHVTGYAPKLFKHEAEMWAERPQPPRAAKVTTLTELIVSLRARGVRVLVVYPPAHALLLVHPSENLPATIPWAAERRALTAVCVEANRHPSSGPPAEFWDFLTPIAPADESLPVLTAGDQSMPRWFDLLHFNSEIGSLMVKRMMEDNADPADVTRFGVRVDSDNLEAHLAAIREAHRRYCETRRDDVAWARELMGNLSAQR
ncbi:hypothetical protein RAHE111665_04365 [Rariglobus hedericola]